MEHIPQQITREAPKPRPKSPPVHEADTTDNGDDQAAETAQPKKRPGQKKLTQPDDEA